MDKKWKGQWECAGMNGYLVASQMIKYKHSGAHFEKKKGEKKEKIPSGALFPFASHTLPLSHLGLCKRAHCSPATGEPGAAPGLEKTTFHLSFLPSSRPDALQNKQTTYLHIIAKTAYQTTSTESLTVWGCGVQQTLAGLSLSLLLDLCFQMETIWSS